MFAQPFIDPIRSTVNLTGRLGTSPFTMALGTLFTAQPTGTTTNIAMRAMVLPQGGTYWGNNQQVKLGFNFTIIEHY